MYNVSVIVPVYNVAPFVERCIRSLMEQSLDKIQYIIIDDSSSDNSLEIVKNVIEEYPNRKNSIIVIAHESNKGVALTRQEGHDLAEGRYMIHCDADDWVDKKYYEILYNKALECDADIVLGDYVYECGNISVVKNFPNYKSRNEFMESEFEHLSLSNRLIKRELIVDNDIRFYEGVNFSEDYGVLFRCYFLSKRNAKIEKPVYYHYNRINPNQTTRTSFEVDKLDQKARCLIKLTDFIIQHGETPSNIPSLVTEKRAVKEGYLLCVLPDFKRWRQAFPEISKVIMKDKKISIPCKIAWWLGQNLNSGFMRCYHKLATK